MAEAHAAREEENQARGMRRMSAALALAGDILHKHSTSASCDVPSVAQALLHALLFLFAAHMSVFRAAAAEDCHARALALLMPPHAFWARALTTLTHARWRDKPLLPTAAHHAPDVRITLSAEAVQLSAEPHL